MKNFTSKIICLVAGLLALVAGTAAAALVVEAPTSGYNHPIPESLLTPDHVKTSIGELKFLDGMPEPATRQKVYDHLDFMRGMDVFLNFVPAASLEAMRRGHLELGATEANHVLVFNKLMDSNALFLTGNTDTVYASAILDLERDGPTVVEVPPGAGPGTVNDAFFRFVVDMGAPGPDRKKGGMYLILPPDYQGDLKPTPNTAKDPSTVKVKIAGKERNVWVAQSRSYVNWLILRGFLVDGKPEAAARMWKTGLKIYPLAKADNPPEMKYLDVSGRVFNTIHANDFGFFEEVWQVLQKEPLDFIDPELRGQAGAIGLVKGKPFEPDAHLKKILEDAVAVANATARTLSFFPRDRRAYLYENSYWITHFVGGDYRWLDGDGKAGRNLDARTMFFYQATVNTPAMAWEIPGAGSSYGGLNQDRNGDIMRGEKNYSLHLPPDVPAKDFWSVVVYDPQTRSQLQTSQPFPSKNSTVSKMDYNSDGSVDLYFGPKPPAGKENNWIQTVPGKTWFLVLRLYGPLKPWFEKTWRPGDLEPL